MQAASNPFPGPQPYRASDRHHFHGRDEVSLDLMDAVISHRVMTVFGPSGAGKSSLLQAAVGPRLGEEFDARCVTSDSWPPQRVAVQGPVGQIVGAIADQLGLGALPPDDLEGAVELAFCISDRPLLLFLDQLEQLLVHHDADVLQAFVARLAELGASRAGDLHVVLSLREDYLGRWTDLLQDHPHLFRHTFRLQRLTVDEALSAVVQAAEAGDVPQRWQRGQLLPFIREMEVPGEWRTDGTAVESAYVQIVCRKLYELGGPDAAGTTSSAHILERYLVDTLARLGPLEAPAQSLLENRFIHATSGRRIQVSRNEVITEVATSDDADRIIDVLEGARILRARRHQRDQLYELGHDWLADPIREGARLRRDQDQRRRARRRQLVATFFVTGAALLAALFFVLYLDADRARKAQEVARARAELAEQQTRHERDVAEQERLRAEQERQAAVAAEADALAARDDAQVARDAAEVSQQSAEQAAAKALEQEGLALAARDQAEVARREEEQRTQELLDSQRLLAVTELRHDPSRAAGFLAEVDPASDPAAWRAEAWRLVQLPLSRAKAMLPGGVQASGLEVMSAQGAVVALVAPGRVGVWSPAGGGWRAWGRTDAAVTGVSVGPRGKWIAASRSDASISVGAASGQGTPRLLQGHTRQVTSMAPSPDGAWLASASRDGSAQLWDLRNPETPPVRLAHQGSVWTVHIGPRSDQVVTASADGSVVVWDLTGGVSARLAAPDAATAALSARFDASGDWIAVGWSDGSATAWRPGDDTLVRLADHGDFVVDAQFRPGSTSQLLTRTRSGAVRFWDLGDGASPKAVDLPTDDGPVLALALSPDGTSLATTGAQGRVDLWSLDADGRPTARLPLIGHPTSAAVVAADFGADSRVLVTASATGELRSWAPARSALAVTIASGQPVTGLGFSADGSVLTREEAGGQRHTWPTAGDGAQVALGTSSRAQHPASDTTVAGLPDGRIKVWRGDPESVRSFELLGHLGAVQVVALSPDGSRLASASADGAVRVWELLDDPALAARLGELDSRCASATDRAYYLGEDSQTAEDSLRTCLAGR